MNRKENNRMIIVLNIFWFIVAFIVTGFATDDLFMGPYRHKMIGFIFAFYIVSSILMLIPANIAHRKGRSFSAFAIYGILLWIVALIHAIMMSSDKVKAEPDKYKFCPYCGETVLKVATKCKHCHEMLE